jgi:hypothetical protein
MPQGLQGAEVLNPHTLLPQFLASKTKHLAVRSPERARRRNDAMNRALNQMLAADEAHFGHIPSADAWLLFHQNGRS